MIMPRMVVVLFIFMIVVFSMTVVFMIIVLIVFMIIVFGMAVIFMIIVAVVACIWLLSYRLHVFAGRVFKKCSSASNSKGICSVKNTYLPAFFIFTEKSGFLVVVEVQNICRILSN